MTYTKKTYKTTNLHKYFFDVHVNQSVSPKKKETEVELFETPDVLNAVKAGTLIQVSIDPVINEEEKILENQIAADYEKEKAQKKEEVKKLLSDADAFIKSQLLTEAKESLNQALKIEPDSTDIKKKISQVDKAIEKLAKKK